MAFQRINSRARGPALAMAFLAAAAGLPARAADEITRAGQSSPVRGEITAVDRDGITIKTGLGANQKEEKVPANEIERVAWKGVT